MPAVNDEVNVIFIKPNFIDFHISRFCNVDDLLTMKLMSFVNNQLLILFYQSLSENRILCFHTTAFHKSDRPQCKFSRSIGISHTYVNRLMFKTVKEKLHSKHSENFRHI